MLSFAIATFFALALAGAVLTITSMFLAYQDKIKAVIVAELGQNLAQTPMASTPYRVRASKAYPAIRRRSFQSAPIRAAA